MCTTRILARSKSGFISECQQCKSIHFAFGTALMAMNTDEYLSFSNQLFQDKRVLEDDVKLDRKCIQISHPRSAEFSVVLTKKELSEIISLVQEANLLIACFSLIEND